MGSLRGMAIDPLADAKYYGYEDDGFDAVDEEDEWKENGRYDERMMYDTIGAVKGSDAASGSGDGESKLGLTPGISHSTVLIKVCCWPLHDSSEANVVVGRASRLSRGKTKRKIHQKLPPHLLARNQ